MVRKDLERKETTCPHTNVVRVLLQNRVIPFVDDFVLVQNQPKDTHERVICVNATREDRAVGGVCVRTHEENREKCFCSLRSGCSKGLACILLR